MLRSLVIAAREKAGRAVQAARELGVQIREKQDKKESVADLEAQFEKAHKDAAAAILELNRLEAELDLESQSERFTKPVESFTGRSSEGEVGREAVTILRSSGAQARRKEQRNLAKQMERFARVGIAKYVDYLRFKDAHEDAFVPYVLEGIGAAMKAFEAQGFKPQESMALLTTAGDLGGFLVPDDFRNEVLKDLAGIAVMRRLCRVEPTGAGALVFPSIQSATVDADVYATGYVGSWRAEGYLTGGTAPTVQNFPKFGQSRVPVHVWAPDAIEVTMELMNDVGANLDSILAEVIAETRALDEDSAFLIGTGVSRPLGLMNTVSGTSVTADNSGHASQLTYEGLVDLFSNLPSQYRQNARFLMASLTLGAIMKLKDGQGFPLFPVGAAPNQLFGKPIEFSEFMDTVAANNHPIVFGDFRYYCIADRQELRVQRMTERFAPNLGLLATARVGGQPLRTAAFRKQKVAA